MLGARLLERLSIYSRTQPEVAVEALDLSNPASQLQRASEFKILVIGGGDGTLSRTLTNLKHTGSKLGVLPLGTANDLARELRIPRSIAFADPSVICDFYRSGEVKYLTLSAVEAENFRSVFINYASFGFVALVTHQFQVWRERPFWSRMRGVWLNRVAYSAAALRHWPARLSAVVAAPEVQPYIVSNSASILFANVRSLMGLGSSNLVGSPFDREIECVIFNSPLSYLPVLLKNQPASLRPIVLGSSAEWSVSGLTQGTAIQVDGEPLGHSLFPAFKVSSFASLPLIVGESVE